jgi:hypothetical protein
MIDRVAGSQWRWVARAASVVASAAQEAMRTRQEGVEAAAVVAAPPPRTAEMVGATDSAVGPTPPKATQEPSATS